MRNSLCEDDDLIGSVHVLSLVSLHEFLPSLVLSALSTAVILCSCLLLQHHLRILHSLPFITEHSVSAHTFHSVKNPLPNMIDIKVSKYDPCTDINFEKCLNLEYLEIVSQDLLELQRIPALCSMSRLGKLILSRATIGTRSLPLFHDLCALKILQFRHCQFDCDWKAFGAALAKTPVKSATFQCISCVVEDIESLLESVTLDYLYISNFSTPMVSTSEVFDNFAFAFHCKRDNPRKDFLIEQDGFARNHNGVISSLILS